MAESRFSSSFTAHQCPSCPRLRPGAGHTVERQKVFCFFSFQFSFLRKDVDEYFVDLRRALFQGYRADKERQRQQNKTRWRRGLPVRDVVTASSMKIT